jgi:hypothetical protein
MRQRVFRYGDQGNNKNTPGVAVSFGLKKEQENLGPFKLEIVARDDRAEKGARFLVRQNNRYKFIEETKQAGVRRLRNASIVDRWKLSGTIGDPEHRAAGIFLNDYLISKSPEYFASTSFDRQPKGQDPHKTIAVEAARVDAMRHLDKAYAALGERGKEVAKHCLGEEETLSWFSKRTKLSPDVAKGILLNVLETLATHYKLN